MSSRRHRGCSKRPKREITKEFIAVYDKWKNGAITAVEAMKKVGMKPNTFVEGSMNIRWQTKYPARLGCFVSLWGEKHG